MTKRADACQKCGAPLRDLFTSRVCSVDCDKLSGQYKLIRRHRMDLGDGWLLWTQDEPPPFGWTRVRTIRDDHTVDEDHDRPTMEHFMKTFGLPATECALKGHAQRIRYWVKGLEGLAYKVP